MIDFLFGQKVTTVTTTRTIIREVTKVTPSEALIMYYNGKITKDQFNKTFPKLALK
jgi:hypothetical protein